MFFTPKPNPHRPFAPSSDQMALAPKVSGNTINGLGETTQRNPSIVYWATNPDTIAHGEMQKWFYTVDPGHPDFAKERAKRAKILNAPLPTKGPISTELKPEEWLNELGKFISKGVCDKVSVADMNQLRAFEGERITQSKVVLLEALEKPGIFSPILRLRFSSDPKRHSVPKHGTLCSQKASFQHLCPLSSSKQHYDHRWLLQLVHK